MTIDLEPNNKGMLIIQRTLVTETQYNRLIRSFKLGTDKHQGEINYGETEFNGFRMVATVSSESLIPQYVEQFFEMVYDLISVGLKKSKDDIPKPRTDLLASLEHLKVFTDKGVPTSFLKQYDVPDNSMIELDKVDTKTILGSIVELNKNNIHTNFGNSTFDEEDEDKKEKINYENN